MNNFSVVFLVLSAAIATCLAFPMEKRQLPPLPALISGVLSPEDNSENTNLNSVQQKVDGLAGVQTGPISVLSTNEGTTDSGSVFSNEIADPTSGASPTTL